MSILALVALWVGQFEIGNRAVPVKVAADVMRFDGAAVHFELEEQLMFEGRLENGEIAGTVAKGEVRGTFRLVRAATADATRFFGTYRASAKHAVWIGKFAELGNEPFLVDFASGRIAPLYPTSETAFIGAHTIGASVFPIDLKVAFAGDKLRTGETSATKIRTTERNVTFRNGDVTLAGKLTIPAGKVPHPAIVLLHGSNDEDRDYLDMWAGFFVSRGFAVLSYDKRGVRESAGDWKRASFDDLAGDALAGVEWLKKTSAIDTKRIGLFGISQGGWIAPLVASRTNIAFIILHAGSGLPVARNGLLYVESELRGYGFPDEEIEQALAYYRLNDEVTRTGEHWDELQAAYRRARERNVEWLLEEPQPKDFWFRQMYRRIMDFDPAPVWAKVSCPVLAFLGELDHNVPAAANQAALQATVNNLTIVVLPKANHIFLRAESGVGMEVKSLSRFAGGYFSAMAAWLAKR